MATHTIEPTRENLHGHFSRDLAPVLTIDSGDTVVFRLIDGGWGTALSPEPNGRTVRFEPRDAEKDAGHALCGPIYVNGAEPGMTLEIEIGDIVPGSWGWTIAGGWPHEVNDRLGLSSEANKTFLRWTIDAEKRTARDQFGRTVSLSPFLGVMGMPGDTPGVLATIPPRVTGGNMDCKELVSGTRLFLPIEVPGGLFSTGDGHAKQGDGEVSVTAIECPMERAELTFHLHRDLHITTPRAKTREGWLTLGFSSDLNEAMFCALDAMLDLMRELHPSITDRADALALASVVVDLRVTQIVNGVKGVHAVLPHDALQIAS